MHHWKDLCAAMERPDLVDDERIGTEAGRAHHRDEVHQLVEDWLLTLPSLAACVEKLEEPTTCPSRPF